MSGGHFQAYGLVIESELPIVEMPAAQASPDVAPDVSVRLGPVPEHLDEPDLVREVSESSAGRLLLRIEGVARYLVLHGSEIVIDPVDGADEHEVRVFLLGTCFGALLHQRGLLVLHASGIEHPSGAVLFAGASGSGKSTLLGELLRRGHRMMVDDVCGVTLHDGTPTVVPSYPRTRVWADSAVELAVDTTGLTRTRPSMEKFERQLFDQSCGDHLPLRRIYHLAGAAGDEVTLETLPPMARFPTILANTYRAMLLDGLGMRPMHFDLASAVAASVEVVRVVRPAEGFRVVEVADRILDHLVDDDVR